MEKIMPIIAVIVLAGAIWMTHHVWTLGDSQEDYETICLGGHEYWKVNFAAKGFLSVKLDDAGKPISCQ